MGLNLGKYALLMLSIAAVVAILTRRLRVPYSVGLVAAGMALALLPWVANSPFAQELAFKALLPALIFEAALSLRWTELRRELPIVLTLATAGVVLSSVLTAGGMHYLAGWQWQAALVFGTLIAATDPVSVIAMFREVHVHRRLRLLIESESLFNDGTAAVAFTVAVTFASGRSLSAFDIAGNLLTTVGGGLLSGAGVAVLVLFFARRTEDHLVELTLTTVAAYGSFLLAEQFHVSGVLATITAGLIIGNRGPLGILTKQGHGAIQAFWEFAAFVANSLVFLLIGVREASQNFRPAWPAVAVAIVVVTLGRAAAVYPVAAAFSGTSLRVPALYQHVLFWGGLRGALALALALGLPKEIAAREEIITVSFAVVAFSVFVQGLTLPPLLRRIKEPREESH